MVKISIITVSYNAENTIEKTIQSVLTQTYQNIEYIVIDGCSKDGTVRIINKYLKIITHFICEPDSGIYDAMNKGIELATGDYINFLNSGDTFLKSTTIEDVVNQLEEESDIVYGDTLLRYPFGRYVQIAGDSSELVNGMPFGHQACFIKAKFHKIHPFDLAYKSSADYNFFYQAHINHCGFQHIDCLVVDYDAYTGFSKSNSIIQMRDNLLIKGYTSKCSYVLLRIKVCKVLFHNCIKSFLPKVIVNRIMHRNLINAGCVYLDSGTV